MISSQCLMIGLLADAPFSHTLILFFHFSVIIVIFESFNCTNITAAEFHAFGCCVTIVPEMTGLLISDF